MQTYSLLDNIDLLIEQVVNTNQVIQQHKLQQKVQGQKIAANIIPSIATSFAFNPLKDAAANTLKVSNNDLVSGLTGFTPASVLAGTGMGLLSLGATGAANKLVQKYQEKKYGIKPPPDTRTAKQKATDTGIMVGQRLLSSATGAAVKGAAGAGLNAIAGPGAASALALGNVMPALGALTSGSIMAGLGGLAAPLALTYGTMKASSFVRKHTFDKLKQNIQLKRQQEAQQKQLKQQQDELRG